MRRAAFLICLLALAGATASAQTIIVLDGGPPAPAFDTDDFSAGLTNWTQIFGSWATTANQLDNTAAGSPNHIEHNAARAADQWMSFKFVDMTNNLSGLMLRHDGAGNGYFFRINNTNGNFKWMKTSNNCVNTSNVNIEQDSAGPPALDPGDYLGVSIVGTGASTVLSYWDFGPAAPGLYATWGPPDATMTTDPGANAVDTPGKVGVCAPGSANLNRWDDFQAGDI